jgi:hypothetical protein
MRRKEMQIQFWRERQNERDHYEEFDYGGKIIRRWMFEE